MTTLNQQAMGGNGAYIASEGGVPMRNRTHNDTEYRIDGHKVLVQAGNPKQKKTPMNSNSENPIYLFVERLIRRLRQRDSVFQWR